MDERRFRDEPVYCIDCYYCQGIVDDEEDDPQWIYCEYWECEQKIEDYCSHGERR